MATLERTQKKKRKKNPLGSGTRFWKLKNNLKNYQKIATIT
jgi:hypothetical protein